MKIGIIRFLPYQTVKMVVWGIFHPPLLSLLVLPIITPLGSLKSKCIPKCVLAFPGLFKMHVQAPFLSAITKVIWGYSDYGIYCSSNTLNNDSHGSIFRRLLFLSFLAVGIKGKLSRFPYYFVVGCNLNSIMHI